MGITPRCRHGIYVDDDCPRCELCYMADQITHNDSVLLLEMIRVVVRDKHLGLQRLAKAYHLIRRD